MATNSPNQRKLRIRLRTFLLLPVLVGISWWWITWPLRTAEHLVRLLQAGEAIAVEDFVTYETPEAAESLRVFWSIFELQEGELSAPRFETRSVRDYFLGQAQFGFSSFHENNYGCFYLGQFRSRFGKIYWDGYPQPSVLYKAYTVRTLSPGEAMRQIQVDFIAGEFALVQLDSIKDELSLLGSPDAHKRFAQLLNEIDQPE